MNSQNILDDYSENLEMYENITNKMILLIKELLSKEKVFSVDGRLKDIKSLGNKIISKNYKYTCLEEITDIIGVRIIVYLPSDVDKIVELLTQHFDVDADNSVDKRSKAIDQFGYSSYHLIVNLKKNRTDLSEYAIFKNIKFEIQVRTILQHVWAEIEHDIGYKSDEVVPKQIKRKFYRLSSILELADEEFENLVLERGAYSSNVSENVENGNYSNLNVDKDSLEIYINHSKLYQSVFSLLSIKLSEKFSFIDEYSSKEMEFIVLEANAYKINSLNTFDYYLKENSEMISDYIFRDFNPLDNNFNKLVLLNGIVEFYAFSNNNVETVRERLLEQFDIKEEDKEKMKIAEEVIGKSHGNFLKSKLKQGEK